MSEANTDLDRRSLLRKGLVAGGIVVSAPVVSTFGVPANAAIASGAGNQFMLRAGNTTSRLTTGNNLSLPAVAPTASATCGPTGYAVANPTVASDFSGNGGTGTYSAPAHNIGSNNAVNYDVTFSITLPTGCAFANVADAIARIRVNGDFVNDANGPAVSNNPQCAAPINMSLTNSNRTASFTARFSERDANNLANDYLLARVTVRIVAIC